MNIKKEIVKESPEFVRDTFNQALINRDNSGLREYKLAKKIRLDQKKQIEQCQDDINTLKKDIKEIKDMFSQILNKL
jgi:Mg2+ and Co2+ transporter CorA